MITQPKIAVTGARGMLGSAILECFSKYTEIYAASRGKGISKDNVRWELFDLLDLSSLYCWLVDNKPDIVIHCAAMVDVDQCERDSEQARFLHVDVTKFIADTILQWGARLIYISTDAVFDGKNDKSYVEEDSVSPLSIYGQTKHFGELEALKTSKSNMVLRTTVIGNQNIAGRHSFVDWILDRLSSQKSLPLFQDVEFTPIHVKHFAEILYKLLTSCSHISGLFHLTGSTRISKYDFGMKLASQVGLGVEHIVPTTLASANFIAPRAKNMALSNKKLSTMLNLSIPDIEQAVAQLKLDYLKMAKKNYERN